MTADQFQDLIDKLATLDQDLADTQEALQIAARALHAVPALELLPPGRTWMITHLYEIQSNLRGAENHIAALVSRLAIQNELQAGGA